MISSCSCSFSISVFNEALSNLRYSPPSMRSYSLGKMATLDSSWGITVFSVAHLWFTKSVPVSAGSIPNLFTSPSTFSPSTYSTWIFEMLVALESGAYFLKRP